LKKKKSKKKDKIDRDSSIDKRSVVKKAASPAPIEQSPGESPSPVWQDHNLTEDLFNNVAPDNFQQQEHFNAHSNNKVPINNYGGDYSEDESGDLSDTRSRASTISRGSTLSRGSARSRDSKLSAHDEQIRRMMMLGAKQPELNQGAERSIIPPARATYDDRLIIFRQDFLQEQVQMPMLNMVGLSRHSRLASLRQKTLTLDHSTAAHSTADRIPEAVHTLDHNTAVYSTMDRMPGAVLITLDRRTLDLIMTDRIMLIPLIATLANLGLLIIPTLNNQGNLVTLHQRSLSEITTRLRSPCLTLL
jgi:hypothetical protein